ncbi:aminodeoxychorismate lyase [Bacillus massilinigeriensis]|uniref:aminodeoxychorismate lyase n=1 Tax=Bacillus mediterraneensis TaxID=1805474 RepID=UPI0008F896FD|nr:aminodeoxychorismate lyase [Bacillus mediterraneensis]
MLMFLNGRIVEEKEASISPLDHGFLYGLGLFETFRIYNRHAFLLDDHLRRLNEGLRMIGIDGCYSRKEILDALHTLLKANRLDDAYVRLNVTAGIHGVGLRDKLYTNPNLLIFMKPVDPDPPLSEKTAAILKLKRNTPEGEQRLKSHHYLNNVLAKQEMKGSNSAEGIFLTAEGYVAEGIVSNLFWQKGGVLFTPSVKTGILNGITRQFVMKLAKDAGFEVREGFFLPEEIQSAEEVFLTNSIQEITAVANFDGLELPGKVGHTVKILHRMYAALREQIWSKDEIFTGG